MIKLSTVIITFNEEKNIRRCLDSVQRVSDEVIVVDSFSADGTEAICREYGVKFMQHAFKGHIQQKNYALEQAASPYVLSLDADEALDERLQDEIIKIKKDWQADSYNFNRLTNYCGQWIRHSGWYPDVKTRLWDKRKGKWGGRNPHDKVIMEPSASQRHIPGNLLHFSFYTIAQHLEQINKFSGIKAQGLYERGKNAGWVKLWFSPFIKFVRDYFLKLGFLDGFYGLVICMNSAHSNFLKYAKLRELYKSDK